MKKQPPLFLISLDFELHWGVSYRLSVDEYKKNLDGTRNAIDCMLQLFNENEIHVTWATVGFLFFNDKKELISQLPEPLPVFTEIKYSNYELLEKIGNNEKEDQYHFGWSVIQKINSFKNQEIGTHTFSHLYCLEDGVTGMDFNIDLKKSIAVAKEKNIFIKSIVFPRNQFNEEHAQICSELGIIYRDNPKGFFHKATKTDEQNIFIKSIRYADTFINILGNTDFSLSDCNKDGILKVKASRFLRPFSNRLKIIEGLKIRRILHEMTHAAKNGNAYHLWWHPHNFGANTKENMANLNIIIKHFKKLQKKYGMQSCCMNEISNYL